MHGMRRFEMARCCVPRRAWRPRRQQRRVTRRRGQHGPSSQEERLLYRPRSVKGQAPAATHINLRASDHPAAPGHGCDATMAPGAAFEFGGGSPGSILPLRRQFWCAAAPRPHFPRPIRPEPQSSPPSSALTEPCMPLSGTANGAGTAADGTEGTVRTPGIAAAAAAAAAALSGRDAAAFSSFLRVLNLPPAAAREAPAQVRPLGGPGGSRAAPGGPAPAGWWVGGMSVPMGAAAAAAGSRGALPLALVDIIDLFGFHGVAPMRDGVEVVARADAAARAGARRRRVRHRVPMVNA